MPDLSGNKKLFTKLGALHTSCDELSQQASKAKANIMDRICHELNLGHLVKGENRCDCFCKKKVLFLYAPNLVMEILSVQRMVSFFCLIIKKIYSFLRLFNYF
jgi:hypothetical protein